ncbi:hypothetical protein XH80_15935 [Bradyrhizobium sp. CCBAU 45384]|nr:hypothetical protein [Bradyrhizobium sp. CCBAU 45384]
MNVLIIARKEIHQAIRNRWVLAATLLLAGLALSLTFLGSAPTGNVGVRALDVVVVSLSSLRRTEKRPWKAGSAKRLHGGRR